jgi:HEAT repeat protein
MRPFWLSLVLLSVTALPARAYVDAAPTLATVLNDATNVAVLRVDKVSRDRRVIIYEKIADLKGELPAGAVKHEISDGLHPREPRLVLDWAEPGQLAVCFANGKVAQICLGHFWYECANLEGPWWRMAYVRWDLSLAYAGSTGRLRTAVTEVLAGKEAVITAVVHGAHGAQAYDAVAYRGLVRSTERPVWRIKASLKMPGSVGDLATTPAFVVGLGAGGPEDLPPLLRALKESEWRTRAGAAEDIALIGRAAREAIPALRSALEDADGRVRAAAAGALAHIEFDSRHALPALLPLLADPAAPTRKAAAAALGEIGAEAEEAVPALIKTLNDSDATVRWAAAEALGQIGTEAAEAVPALAAMRKDPAVRGIAIDALGGIGPPARSVVPALLEDLKSDDVNLQRVAAMALVRIDPKAARPALPLFIEALKSSDPRVRWDAMLYVRSMGHSAKETIPALLDIVKTGDGVAADTLGSVIGPESKSSIPALTEMLRGGVDVSACLLPIGPDVVPAVTNVLQDEKLSSEAWRAAFRTLGQLGPKADKGLLAWPMTTL